MQFTFLSTCKYILHKLVGVLPYVTDRYLSHLLPSDKEENAVIEESKQGVMKLRALYQFDARNADELSFMPGDIIAVGSTASY